MIIQTKTYPELSIQKPELWAPGKTRKGHPSCGLERTIDKHEHIVYLTNPGEEKNVMHAVLEENGYEVRTLDFDNILQSVSWNPLRFIYNSEGAKAMADVFFAPCKGDKRSIKIAETAKLFVEASIDFLFDSNNYFDGPKRTGIIEDLAEDCINLRKFARLLDLSTIRSGGSEVTEWQIYFEALVSIKKNCSATNLYEGYLKRDLDLLNAGFNRAMGVMRSVLSPLVREVFVEDETGLDNIGEKGQALFVVRPKWESNYVPLFNLACRQILNMLSTPQSGVDDNHEAHLVLSKDLGGLGPLLEKHLAYL